MIVPAPSPDRSVEADRERAARWRFLLRWSARVALATCSVGLVACALAPREQPPREQPPREQPTSSNAPGDTAARAPSHASIVVFLRHAEKDASDKSGDPGLSDLGRKRAGALAQLLARSGVSHLYSSEYKRTRETLEPLRERIGGRVEVVPAADAARWLELLESAPAGTVAVVAGHANTIPALVERLGGRVADLESTPQGAMIRDDACDRMFVATLDGPDPAHKRIASLIELRYGD